MGQKDRGLKFHHELGKFHDFFLAAGHGMVPEIQELNLGAQDGCRFLCLFFLYLFRLL